MNSKHFDMDGLYVGPEEWDADDWGPDCPECGADLEWVRCETCDGERFTDHDCGDDTCVCLHPEDNLECQACEGFGGWYRCWERHGDGKRRTYLPSDLPRP